MGKFTRQAAVVATVIAASAVMFTGSALASVTDGNGGSGGNGGGANANCLIPIGVTAGVIGQGGANSQCNAVGGGAGNGGNGVG
jgi:hypothetical protein